MTKIVDPIKLVAERSAAERAERRETARVRGALKGLTQKAEVAAAREDAVPYEMPLVPPAGAKLLQLTCASTYRDPIPVQFDPATRTCYPIPKAN